MARRRWWTQARSVADRRRLPLEHLEDRSLLSAAPLDVPIESADVQLAVNSITPVSPGDANLDGAVDLVDFQIWSDHFLLPGTWSLFEGDFNLDGSVDAGDYTIWANNYSPAVVESLTSTVPAAAVSPPLDEPRAAATLEDSLLMELAACHAELAMATSAAVEVHEHLPLSPLCLAASTAQSPRSGSEAEPAAADSEPGVTQDSTVETSRLDSFATIRRLALAEQWRLAATDELGPCPRGLD